MGCVAEGGGEGRARLGRAGPAGRADGRHAARGRRRRERPALRPCGLRLLFGAAGGTPSCATFGRTAAAARAPRRTQGAAAAVPPGGRRQCQCQPGRAGRSCRSLGLCQPATLAWRSSMQLGRSGSRPEQLACCPVAAMRAPPPRRRRNHAACSRAAPSPPAPRAAAARGAPQQPAPREQEQEDGAPRVRRPPGGGRGQGAHRARLPGGGAEDCEEGARPWE